MKAPNSNLWGLMAVFNRPEPLIAAVTVTRQRGFRKFDAYSPFPLEEIDEQIEPEHTGVAAICWIGGFLGAGGGFWLMTWNTTSRFPLNVGGRPLFSWPAYVPITFELMVLFGGIAAFFAVLALNRLPRLHHPVFNIEEFQKRNSSDGFFLVIEAEDPLFSLEGTHEFLRSLNPVRTYEVPGEISKQSEVSDVD